MGALPQLSKRLSRSFFSDSTSPFRVLTTLTSSSSYSSASRSSSDLISSPSRDGGAALGVYRRTLLGSPWCAIAARGLKVSGSSVLKVDHSHEGRGKATIKVELRDVDSGNKVSQRFGTEETVERVFVEAKPYVYMCTDRDGKILLMDPDTLDQLEVNEDLFGKNAKYLQDDMRVKVEVYNGIPLSATVPKHVTCTVKEAQPPVKGIGVTPREKIAVLQNGLSIKVPPHVLAGEAVVIDTTDDSYVRRAKA
ncbi:Translation elongation factor [Parasponia andersonii]|uniref:Translation elongation factor n=1 Tax=Parasponia andersonii TaxID=3476 RepID=A0A2P5BBG9_PARAD|nr:Translation elongation factor [Parasponia andersonii]